MDPNTSFSDEQLDELRQIGDPLADEAIEQIVAEKGAKEAGEIFNLLIRRIELPISELPESLHLYLAESAKMPVWVDWEKVKLANELFLDHGPKFLVFLYFKSLPLLYSCANGAQVLVQTGRLSGKVDTQDIFTRRIAETGQFLLDVMAPGALEHGGKGVQTIQKIRLIHASIRYFVGKNNTWDSNTLGVPVNQEDLAITLTTFSSVITDALEQIGITESPARIEAYQHTWAVIGYLLGIREAMLPTSPIESRNLMNKILERQSAGSEAGTQLTSALLGFAKPFFPAEAQNTPILIMQHLIGEERSTMLGVSHRPGCLGILLPEVISRIFKLGEKLEDRIKEPLKVFIDVISWQMMEQMVQFFDKYKQRQFELPDVYEKLWNRK
ncbi:MAG: oxygenase MpaB family protein [Saprospiraceae bacterium]